MLMGIISCGLCSAVGGIGYNFYMKSLLIYNPAAGRMPLQWFVGRARQVLTRLGWHVSIAATQSGQHATALARQAAADGMDVVFAVGGDGTAGQVAAGLSGSQTALGILPAGTSNVLAADLGMPPFDWNRWWALEDNVCRLVGGQVLRADMGLCNRQPFLLWAGIGLDALSIHKLEPRPRFEKFISVPVYAAQTIWNAAVWNGQNMAFDVDGVRLQGHYQLAVVTNIRTYLGGLAVLSPNAHLDDGVMDLWLFKGSTLGDVFRHTFSMMSGCHLSNPDVTYFPFKTMSVESEQPLMLQTDGDPAGAARQISFEILPGTLRLLVPQTSLHLFRNVPAGAEKPAFKAARIR